MKRIGGLLFLLVLAGCSGIQAKHGTANKVKTEMAAAAKEAVPASKPEVVDAALIPPLAVELPKGDNKPVEAKFDLAVNNTPAKEVFAAIGSGTRYNMLPLPGVDGNLTLNLKDVTVFEALDTVRALYGYDYRLEGKNIYIQPVAMQTRLFKIDYLAAMRDSSSSLSVKASGSGAGSSGAAAGGVAVGRAEVSEATPSGGRSFSSSSSVRSGSPNASYISTTQSPGEFNFWTNLEETLRELTQPHGSVVINRMSGVIVVRAMPDELRRVKEFLDVSQLSIERQVIIEAKFVEVTLSDSFQSGINWAGFMSNSSRSLSAGGVTTGGTLLPSSGGVPQSMSNSLLSSIPGANLGAAAATVAGSVFGLAFQTNNFAAMLSFLETQGDVHVLSSPRIATLNNQKAVLKVGTDEPYVTSFSPGTSTTVAGGSNTLPTPNYTVLFSGISLDVTPRINENNEIILHVHPAISQVTSKIKDAGGGQIIQMASTNIEETDSVVRAKDGQIVVIGGLMSHSSDVNESGLPGFLRTFLGSTSKVSQKRELVIMLKSTVVDSDQVWADEVARSRNRMDELSR